MAKSDGMGMKLYVDGYDISGDHQSFVMRGGPAVIETTGVDVEAYERIGGRRDGAIDAVTYFNPETIGGGGAADRSHLVYRALPLTDRMVTVLHPDSGEAWNLVAKQGGYDPTVAADGAITCQVNSQSDGYGLEVGKLITGAKQTLTGAGSVSGVDFGAGASFGAQFHLQVFAFTGTSATIKIQQSSDNAVGDAYADVTGGAFTVVTARTTQRLETVRSQAVEQWLRATVTGTFTNLVFAVTGEINLIDTRF